MYLPIAGSLGVLVTALLVGYMSFIYKHSAQTCNRLARFTCALGTASWVTLIVFGIIDTALWYLRPHMYDDEQLNDPRTIVSLIYG
jgi:hypothetical protein